MPKPDRIFLNRTELDTFKIWGVPVRYIRTYYTDWRKELGDRCKFCGKLAEQVAHRIPYGKGILQHRLTPAYLHRRFNLVPVCRDHNRRAEWPDSKINRHLAELPR